MATNPDEPTLSTSSMFPFSTMTRPSIANPLNISSPYNPLTHWGNISSLRNPYSSFSRSNISNTEEDENNINSYHNPRTKHYQESMDKQRLEHILFSGDQSNPLNQQKERMRQKLLAKNKRKNNTNSPQMNSNNHNNSNNTDFQQKKKNKKNKNKNGGNKRKHSKPKNKNKKHNRHKNKKNSSKSPSQESQKANNTMDNNNSLELDSHSIPNQFDRHDLDGDGDGDVDVNDDVSSQHELIPNGYKKHDTATVPSPQNGNMNMNGAVTEDIKEEEENTDIGMGVDGLLEILDSQTKEMNVLKQNVFLLSESVNKLSFKMDGFEGNSCKCETSASEISAIQKEILSLKKRVNDLECQQSLNENNLCKNRHHEAVREWLKNEVNLEQYYHIFIDNGFEDMLSLRTLDMEILNNIKGIDKIGHKSKILYFVEKLNQQNIDSTHEF